MKLGSRVCIAAKMLCFWQCNPLEIVYVNEGSSQTFNKVVSNGLEVTRSKGQGEYNDIPLHVDAWGIHIISAVQKR